MGHFVSGCACPGTDEVCFSGRSRFSPHTSPQRPGAHHRIKSVPKGCAACIGKCRLKGLGAFPNSVLQRKISRCIYVCTACWYNVIDETKIVSSRTVIWLCRFPKHSNIEVLTGAESGKTACLVSIQELLTA